jgi:ribulose-5-phosphate 4-epimerase/fuculose-1-phosphate aldolase
MSMSNDLLLQALAQSRRTTQFRCSAAEWEMRVDLAACYRLVAHFRMTDWIYNHISAAVPGEPSHYLVNAFGLMYEEISASNLVKVDIDGKLVDDVPYDVNPAAFVIHGALHQARPDAVCVLHTHTAAGVAVSTQAEGLLPISQHALRFHDRVAYHAFEGIALDLAEQRRLIEDVGDKKALILRNHGLLTMGTSVSNAFKEMFFLERACQIQVAALAGGRPLTLPPAEVCEHTARQFDNDASFLQGRDWRALLRLLDRIDPSYKQ